MSSWLFVAIVQGGVGYAQYFTGVPEVLVGVHLAGATILWVVTVRLALSSLDVTEKCAPTPPYPLETERLFGSRVTNV
jgi:cytochrome c oxidase assembly protein subunit 15